MNDFGHARPDCQFCDAKEKAIIMIGRRFACCKCAMAYEDFKNKKDDAEIEVFKDYVADNR